MFPGHLFDRSLSVALDCFTIRSLANRIVLATVELRQEYSGSREEAYRVPPRARDWRN